MPRIDPLQLLRCLSVLLSADGGIKSKDEVQRLASLMTKFSKKLVSKCIYLQILKTTKTELLGLFMGVGGWTLIHQWLSDAIIAKNLALIRELLELLLICPVEVDRLKSNNCPKLVKGLTKEGSNENVRLLASKLVERWLKVVKGQSILAPDSIRGSLSEGESVIESPDVEVEVAATWVKEETVEENVVEEIEPDLEPVPVSTVSPDEDLAATSTEVKTEVKTEETPSEGSSEEASGWDAPTGDGELPVYKITIRDGKQVLAKVPAGERTRTPRKQTFDSSTIKQDTPKIISSIVVKEVIEDIPSSPEPVVRSSSAKLKLPKQDVSADNNKSSKDIQKKIDAHISKPSVEKRIKLIDPIREKPKETPKETREREKKERKEKELLKLKEKRLEKAAALAIKAAAQAEKDKATLAKLVPPPISKLGKIPKKARTEEVPKDGKKTVSEEKKSPEHKPSPLLSPDTKKPSISIEAKKPSIQTATRPKTVKSFNSKFRSTGLEEEVKPPTTKSVKKSSSTTEKQPSKSSLKRPSPIKDALPPGKKLKAATVEPNTEDVKKTEKPGGVKYTPAKPKPSFLQESDMFMDALTASTKKEPRKRKRRTSNSKDGPEVKKEPSKDETSPPGSPPSDEVVSPVIPKPVPKFYRDTLEASEEDVVVVETAKVDNKTPEREEPKTAEIVEEGKVPTPPLEEAESTISTDKKEASTSEDGVKEDKEPKDSISKDADSDELKGVLVHHKTRKGPKKKVSWKVEELEAIRFFDLDETERVNVTKTFTDMKQMERSNERESFIFARKLASDDNMEEKTMWKSLTPIDMPPSVVEPGKKSREKDIQFAREKIILQVLYFNRLMIPDSAIEPDLEMHPTSDPVVIPLDDVTGNPDSVTDYTGTPWPDPKPMIIPNSPPANVFPVNVPQPFMPAYIPGGPPFPNNPQIFAQNNIPPAMMVSNGMPPGNMTSMSVGGGDWRTGDGKVVSMNEMPMDMYNQGGPGMGMGMSSGMGPGPNGPMDGPMNYHMMQQEDMNQFPMQGYPMQGPNMQGPNMQGPNMQGPSMQGPNMQGPNMQGPPMFQGYRGGPRGPMGPRGRGHMASRGQWHRPNGGGHSAPWQGGPGRGGPRQWAPKRGRICRDYAKDGFCRQGEQCAFIHHD